MPILVNLFSVKGVDWGRGLACSGGTRGVPIRTLILFVSPTRVRLVVLDTEAEDKARGVEGSSVCGGVGGSWSGIWVSTGGGAIEAERSLRILL